MHCWKTSLRAPEVSDPPIRPSLRVGGHSTGAYVISLRSMLTGPIAEASSAPPHPAAAARNVAAAADARSLRDSSGRLGLIIDIEITGRRVIAAKWWRWRWCGGSCMLKAELKSDEATATIIVVRSDRVVIVRSDRVAVVVGL